MRDKFNPKAQYGWICPVCGRVNAPYMPVCGCNGKTFETDKTSNLLKEMVGENNAERYER